MRIAALAMLLLAVSAHAADAQTARAEWRSDVPCAAARRMVAPGGDPGQPAPTPQCPNRSCVDLPGGGRACTCADTTGVDSVRVEQPGESAREWAAEAGAAAFGGGWEAAYVPLARGAAPTLVMAQRGSVGNGLGVEFWTLWLVERGAAGVPPHVDVQEYGFGGSWVQPASGGACRLFATRWTHGSEPGRPDGLYLQGRWLDARDGEFRPAADRPTVERRYLFSFQDERGAGVPGAPFAWFRHPSARVETLPRTPTID